MQPQEIFTLTPDSIRKLQADHDRLAHQLRNLEPLLQQILAGEAVPNAFIAKVTQTLTARVGATPGTGKAQILRSASGAALDQPVRTEEHVLNLRESEIEVGAFGLVVRDPWGDYVFLTSGSSSSGTGENGDSCKVTTPKCCICPPKNNAVTPTPPILRVALCGFPPESFLDGTHEVKLQGQVEATNSVEYWLFDEGFEEFVKNTSTTDKACWWSSAPSPANWNSMFDPTSAPVDPDSPPPVGHRYRIDVFVGGERSVETGYVEKPFLNVTVVDDTDEVIYQFGTWCAFPLGVGFDPTAGIRQGSVETDPESDNFGKGIDDATGLYRKPQGLVITGCCTFELEAKPPVGSRTGWLGWHVLPIDVLNICNGLGIPCPLSFYLPSRKWEADTVPRAAVNFGCGCEGCPSGISSATMNVTFADVKALLGYTSGTPNYGSDADAINRGYVLTIAQPTEALQFFEDNFGSPGSELGIDGAACIWILGKLDPQVPPGTGLALMAIVKDIAAVGSNIMLLAHQTHNLNGDPNEVYAVFGAAQTAFLPSEFFDNADEASYLKIASCAPMSEAPPRTVWTGGTPPDFAGIVMGTEGHSDGTLDTTGTVSVTTSGEQIAVGCQTDFGTIYVATVTRCCDEAVQTYYLSQNYYIVGGVYSFNGQCGTLTALVKYDGDPTSVEVLPSNQVVYHSACGGCSGACCCGAETTAVEVSVPNPACLFTLLGFSSPISLSGLKSFATAPCRADQNNNNFPVSGSAYPLGTSIGWVIDGCLLKVSITVTAVVPGGGGGFASATVHYHGTINSNNCPENEGDPITLGYAGGGVGANLTISKSCATRVLPPWDTITATLKGEC